MSQPAATAWPGIIRRLRPATEAVPLAASGLAPVRYRSVEPPRKPEIASISAAGQSHVLNAVGLRESNFGPMLSGLYPRARNAIGKPDRTIV